MKSLLAAAVLAATTVAAPAFAADVGVSIQISEPGVFGRVDIGRFPQPELVVTQPVIIGRALPAVPPVYMWVPPEHRRDWRHHCAEYHACGVPVYFVRDEWYNQRVRPHQGERYEVRRDEHRDEHHDDRGRDRGPAREHDDHDHDRH